MQTTKNIKIQTSLRVDQESFYSAKDILNEIGMNFSEAVNIFTKMIVKHKGLPFDVKIPNDETVQAIQRSRNNQNEQTFTIEEFKSFLNEHKN
jgi:DNA-damage-inducible protein J